MRTNPIVAQNHAQGKTGSDAGGIAFLRKATIDRIRGIWRNEQLHHRHPANLLLARLHSVPPCGRLGGRRAGPSTLRRPRRRSACASSPPVAAASPFGVPGRNGAEIVIEALNAGTAPAPDSYVGLGGTKVDAKYVDEAGSTAQVATEIRNPGAARSRSTRCRRLHLLRQLPRGDGRRGRAQGAHRLFRLRHAAHLRGEAAQARIPCVAARDHGQTGAARYLLAKKKDVTLYSGINQNHAWAKDRDFAAMALALKAKSTRSCFEAVRRRVRRRDSPCYVEVAGASFQLLGRRPRRIWY